ncbi:MAG: acyl-CoA thioesterase [Gaiellaceae bacterium]
MPEGVVTHVEQVRFRDLDPMGHVNNAVFLTYLEQARNTFLEELGVATGLNEMNMILARAEIDFRAPVSLGQEIEIAVRAGSCGTKSFELDYELVADGTIVAEAKTIQVTYDYSRHEAVPLPDAWREKLSGVPA